MIADETLIAAIEFSGLDAHTKGSNLCKYTAACRHSEGNGLRTKYWDAYAREIERKLRAYLVSGIWES